MKNFKNSNTYKVVFIIAFLFLNILNGYLVTTPIYNRNLTPYDRDLFMVLNYILGDLGFLIVFISLSLFFFKTDKQRFRFLNIVTIAISILCIGMMLFSYNYYGMLFSFGNLKALDNPAGKEAFGFVLSAILNLLLHAQFLSLIPIFLLIGFFIYLKKKQSNSLENSLFGYKKSRFYFATSFLIIGILLMSNSVNSYKAKINETWYEENRNVLYGVQTVGLYNYYIYDFYSYYFTNIYELNEEKVKYVENQLEYYSLPERVSPFDMKTYGNNTDYTGVVEGKNLILIQAESFSNYLIGLKVNGVEITPNLNRMVDNGIYFKNFYTTVGIGNTSDAEFSVMTGLYPTGEDLAVFTYANSNYGTIAKDFKKANYNTFSIHGNTRRFYSRGENHVNIYGFDKHYGIEDLINNSPLVHNWINDEELLKTAVDLMDQSEELDFVYSILVSAHTPYNTDPYIESILANEKFDISNYISDTMLLGYLKHQHYVDYCIGKFLDYLELKGYSENTIVAVYGDHGGGISQEALIKSLTNLENQTNPLDENLLDYFSLESQYAYRDLSQKVPFIIYDPSQKDLEPLLVEKVRGETDIYRTISNLFLLDSKYYFGVDGLSDEPSFIYNPRNLDTFVDNYIIFLPPLVSYNQDGKTLSADEIKKYADIVKNYKDINDKILKYLNAKK